MNTALNLSDAYWKWAKNQAFEKEQPFHPGMLQGPCVIETTLTGTHIQASWAGTARAQGSLPPLTSAVVEITFARGMEIGHVSATSSGGEDVVRYKAYVQPSNPDCATDPDGERDLGVFFFKDKLYVLVSNTSPTDTHTFEVVLRGA